MSNSYFQFKQFTIHHDRCAMKVGTDGVLLGAWGQLPKQGKVLDIGTGTGLIALMAAQRAPKATITAIDIDPQAVKQARENVDSSPFASRVEVFESSLLQFARNHVHLFDAILCNPPFFEEQLLPPNLSRSAARHTHSLPFEELIPTVSTLLSSSAPFSVILPTMAFAGFRQLCFQYGLTLSRLCHIQTTPLKPPKRVLATFVKGSFENIEETQMILNNGTHRSDDYAALTRDFYLW